MRQKDMRPPEETPVCSPRRTLASDEQSLNYITEVDNLNQWFSPGDTGYIIMATGLVMIMIPGLAFLYSGLARRKSALSMIWAVMMSLSVITFQWYFWGYSLALSPTATNGFIGNLDKFGLRNVLGAPSPASPLIPELLFSIYEVYKPNPIIATVRGR